MRKIRNQKGITLIALVVTMIVLIILAGVSISLVLGENGIITKAKLEKTQTEQATLNEEIMLNETAKYIEDLGTSNTIPNLPVNPLEEIKSVEEVKGGDYFEKKTTIKDNNGNLIKVPEGFKIAEDSGISVSEGIVIEDNDIISGIGNNRGNQYVWIPVGNEIKKSDGTSVDITLGRYIFASDGKETLQQSAENYTDEILIDNYFKELAVSRIGVASSGLDGLNTTALNLKGFIDSVKENGGYYIARYEASYGTDGKVNSKISNSYSETTTPTTEGTLWNYITQINAATASRELYTTATTDLINSYAWDTAIVYIQNFSEDKDYSYQTSKNTSLANTGTNGDEVCKINDMTSNTYEWTTEYSTNTSNSNANPCTTKGGDYYYSSRCTSTRGYNLATSRYRDLTFRPTLYI